MNIISLLIAQLTKIILDTITLPLVVVVYSTICSIFTVDKATIRHLTIFSLVSIGTRTIISSIKVKTCAVILTWSSLTLVYILVTILTCKSHIYEVRGDNWICYR